MCWLLQERERLRVWQPGVRQRAYLIDQHQQQQHRRQSRLRRALNTATHQQRSAAACSRDVTCFWCSLVILLSQIAVTLIVVRYILLFCSNVINVISSGFRFLYIFSRCSPTTLINDAAMRPSQCRPFDVHVHVHVEYTHVYLCLVKGVVLVAFR